MRIFFEVGDQRYCHIIDPKTGYPASRWVAVTVLAPNAWEADAYSTALFSLGDAGREFVSKKQANIQDWSGAAKWGALFFEMQGDSVVTKKAGRVDE